MAKIFLDVDGVFADFQGACAHRLGHEWIKMSDYELWGNLEKEFHFFYGLDLIPDSTRIITHLMHPSLGHHLEFLTALPRPTGRLVSADKDKREWLAENISRHIPVNTVLGGKNKAKYVTSPTDVLIDDYRRNIDAWVAAGGVGVLHRNIEDTLDQLYRLNLI